MQKRSMAKAHRTTLESFLETLQLKLRINFSSPGEAYRFFDVSNNQKCKKEHFVFCCAFLEIDHDFGEVVELFEILDTKGDGVLDDIEFDGVFEGMQDSWNSHHHAILNSVLRESGLTRPIKLSTDLSNVDINFAPNTAEKLGPTRQDIH